MSSLNAGIILQGITPDIVGGIDRGFQAGRRNYLADLYRQHGEGIAAGDQNALNALARFDPNAALGVKDARQAMDARALNMDATRQHMDILSAQEERAVAEYARGLKAEEAAAQIGKIKQATMAASAAQTPEEWDRIAQQFGAPELVGQFASREAILRQHMSVAEIMEREAQSNKGPDYVTIDGQLVDRNAPGGPAAVPIANMPESGPDWRAATPEEAQQFGAQAGQINTTTGEFKKTSVDRGMTIESTPGGGMRVVQGPGVGKENDGGLNPASPSAMLRSVEGILNDPALDFATGWLEWTQNVPGTQSKRFGARVKQLDGQAFLQAFESLKGGGQITEIEGIKATQAIARLDTAQRPEDYRAALEELRELLITGQSRPEGWAEQKQRSENIQNNTPEVGAIEGGYRFKGGDPSRPENWEQVSQ